MKRKLLEFLKALESAIPPAPAEGSVAAAHHGISYCKYGSDETGWDDRLGLHVRVTPSRTITIFIDDGDFEKPVEQLVAEVVSMCPSFSRVAR